jgi:hypothetical protein
MLKDLSLIALTYSKQAVQQRLTFKLNPKGESSAPVVFLHDPNGELIEFVLDLCSLTPIAMPPLSPIKESDEDKFEASKTFEVETQSEKTARQQKGIIDEWIKDEDHRMTTDDRHPLELYAQLTDDEFLYVQELQRVYDESRCYFVQWILSKEEIKELVNSARISAIQQNKKFTWTHTRLEILKSLTDVTLTARFLVLARLKRKHGSTAKVWISQVLTRRALLEDTKFPTPTILPETLYMELTLGQMSHQETTLFECPCIGDDLNEKGRSGDLLWSLEWLRLVIDRCSNPCPNSVGSKLPSQNCSSRKGAKQLRAQSQTPSMTKITRRNCTLARQRRQTPRRRANAPPTSYLALSAGLKRSDLTATVDGKLLPANSSASFSMTLNTATVSDVIRKTTHAQLARSLQVVGGPNSTRTRISIG